MESAVSHSSSSFSSIGTPAIVYRSPLIYVLHWMLADFSKALLTPKPSRMSHRLVSAAEIAKQMYHWIQRALGLLENFPVLTFFSSFAFPADDDADGTKAKSWSRLHCRGKLSRL